MRHLIQARILIWRPSNLDGLAALFNLTSEFVSPWVPVDLSLKEYVLGRIKRKNRENESD